MFTQSAIRVLLGPSYTAAQISAAIVPFFAIDFSRAAVNILGPYKTTAFFESPTRLVIGSRSISYIGRSCQGSSGGRLHWFRPANGGMALNYCAIQLNGPLRPAGLDSYFGTLGGGINRPTPRTRGMVFCGNFVTGIPVAGIVRYFAPLSRDHDCAIGFDFRYS